MNRRKVFEKCGKTKLLRIRGKGGGERLFLIFFWKTGSRPSCFENSNSLKGGRIRDPVVLCCCRRSAHTIRHPFFLLSCSSCVCVCVLLRINNTTNALCNTRSVLSLFVIKSFLLKHTWHQIAIMLRGIILLTAGRSVWMWKHHKRRETHKSCTSEFDQAGSTLGPNSK